MARIAPEAFFHGPAGNFSYYKMRGVEKPIVRRKGGASKQRIKTDPVFEQTRRINAEFGGRAAASRWIMWSLVFMKPLADHNIAGPLNACLKPVQALDTSSDKGHRSILLSHQPDLLEGFSLNRNNPFESVVRAPLEWSLDRRDRLSYVSIPALTPGINFYPDVRYPVFGFVCTLGTVPDLFYHPFGYRPSTPDYEKAAPVVSFSEWFPVRAGAEALSIQLPDLFDLPDEQYSRLLSVGIRYGTLHHNNKIEQVRHAGAAKIIATA